MNEAIKEAYASAPSNQIIYHTIELYHSNFVGEDGVMGQIRVVSNHKNIFVTLEDTAPHNANETVTFIAMPFRITLPAVDDKSNPYAMVTIDNISRTIVNNIERVLGSTDPIGLIYRPYLSTNLTEPQYNPPLEMILSDISANIYQVSGKASFSNLSNKLFPNQVYTLRRFIEL